jgi:type II secretory pathway pseudopilin PulG
MMRQTLRHGDAGFSLVETMVALLILVFGLLMLAQTFALGMNHMATSSANVIAREKAREAIESVHTARDTRVITWAQIRNVSQGGVFRDGEQTLLVPGPDGLVNTADDGQLGAQANVLEEIVAPGPDGLLGTADDLRTPLITFWRTIAITDVANSPSLREILVTIRYVVGNQARRYQLRTFVSSFS